MPTEAPRLSEEQRELVAIGASIGAGCHRCLDHHLKIAARTELAADRVAAATASATSVAAIATERLSTHVRTSPDPANAGSATPLDRELAAFGAAIGANDLEGIERHVHAAAALGMCAARLREAVDVAEKVQQNAGRLHVNEAKRLIASVGAEAAPTNEDTGESCGCDEDAAAQQPAEDAVAAAMKRKGRPELMTTVRSGGCVTSVTQAVRPGVWKRCSQVRSVCGMAFHPREGSGR